MKKLLFAMMALLLPFVVMAQVQIPSPISFELPNGLKVFVVQSVGIQGVKAMLLVNRQEPMEVDKVGMLSMAGEMLRRGSDNGKLSKKQLEENLKARSITLRTTSNSVSMFFAKKYFNDAMEMLSNIALKPTFAPAEFEDVKKAEYLKLDRRDQTISTVVQQVSNKRLFGAVHPFGKVETMVSVTNVSLDDIALYYKTYWKPNISYLIFIGDINVPTAKRAAEIWFGTWQKGESIPMQNDFPTPQAPSTFVGLVNTAPHRTDLLVKTILPIAPTAIDAVVSLNVAGDVVTRLRLPKVLESNAIAVPEFHYDVDIQKLGSTFEITTTLDSSTLVAPIAKAIVAELKKIQQSGITREELENSQHYLATTLSAAASNNPDMLTDMAQNIANNDLSVNYYKEYDSVLAAIAPSSVRSFIVSKLNTNALSIWVVGDIINSLNSDMQSLGSVHAYDDEGDPLAGAEAKKAQREKLKKHLDSLTFSSGKDDEGGAMTPFNCVKKYIKVVGGDSLKFRLHTLELKGKTMIADQHFTFSKSYIIPTMYFESIDDENGTPQSRHIFKQGKMYAENEGQPQASTFDELEYMQEKANLVEELQYVNVPGYTFAFGDKAVIDGYSCYSVHIKSPLGREIINFYDEKTFLKRKSITQLQDAQFGGMVAVETYYREYKAFNKVQLPVKMFLDQGGRMKVFTTITDSKINKDISPSIFFIPASNY